MKLLTIFLAIALISAGVAIAANSKERYFVKTNSKLLKSLTGVNHEFKHGYTTELTKDELKAMKALGVEVEPVAVYQTLGRPVCGDGVCQGNEARTCPADCSGAVEERTCYPSSQIPYGVAMVNGGNGGANVNVAVLDTGVAKHPDLDVKVCKDTTKRGIKNGCNDGVGHGTHVAGTIAANGGFDGKGIYGVAPETNLWAIKVCKTNGCWADDIATGIRYAADHGANIISMSLGGNSESSLIKDAIDYAVSKDVLVVAAAGNDGPELGSIDYPGANAKVIAVAAVDNYKNVPSWSSRGLNDNDYLIETKEVEFAAPGIEIESTYNDGCYAKMSGTSMATPHIAGLAAKLWQGSAVATRTYLQSIAQDIGETGDDPATGLGFVSA